MTRTQDILDFQGADMIDVRDVIARVEELRDDRDSETHWDAELAEELKTLEALLTDLCGNGGDEQWEGEWYPVGLIRESYFKTHAQELAEDIGAIDSNASWPNTCIDWDKAARELKMDYTSTEFDGATYYYR